MKEKLHIIPHVHAVDVNDRNKLLGHASFVIWFTGLSGSGKSTLASQLEQELHKQGIHTYILDGDNIRTGLNKDLNFSADARTENIRRIGEVSKLFIDAGVVVLSAFVSPYKEDREAVKQLVGAERFVEVFVDCPLHVCEARDVKGLYAKARAGQISNFTGVNAPFEVPEKPDVHIKSAEISVEEGVSTLRDAIQSKLKIDE